ncbi:DUF3784 domain-containing protein [Metabacillus fastidiosus]|nr:DUF3784 domain-containing protein [Metabacillus fastidiosus]MEC2078412.1 DUF3784 domain-containing protein [Metabacillus fastidiosus]
MIIAILVIMIPILIMAIVLSKGKGAFLLAGYNTMSESEKEKYKEKELCIFMSKIMYGICLGLLLITLSEQFKIQAPLIIGLIITIGLPLFSMVYVNTGNRFKKEIHNRQNNSSQTNNTGR